MMHLQITDEQIGGEELCVEGRGQGTVGSLFIKIKVNGMPHNYKMRLSIAYLKLLRLQRLDQLMSLVCEHVFGE